MVVEIFSWPFSFQEALPTSDHGVAGSNPAGGEILPEPKRRFIAQSLSCSPFHRLEMTEILLKGRKTLTHPSIHLSKSMCRTWGWNPPPAAYQVDARPTELPRPAKKFKSRRVVHTAERLALPRSMSSVQYSLEAIFKSLTQTASRCTESCIIIQQSSWSHWNTI